MSRPDQSGSPAPPEGSMRIPPRGRPLSPSLVSAVALLLVLPVMAGCGDGMLEWLPPEETVSWDFTLSEEGWSPGFCDLPADHDTSYALTAERRGLPAELDTTRWGFFLSGSNHSDDLFMFLKRRITGLRPDTRYRLYASVRIATNAPTGCAGIGGPPGESVYLKFGAADQEPRPVEQDGFLRLSVPQGSQAAESEHALVLGDIANGSRQCLDTPYRFKTLRTGSRWLEAETDGQGGLWVFVGTDSGFEGVTSIYYDMISIGWARIE